MENFISAVTDINGVVNNVIWGVPALILLIGTGIIVSFLTKFFQVSHFGHWWKETIGRMFRKGSDVTDKSEKQSISQFQALCTALAATVGTGNIAGVATAIAAGGPGAVFWMWIAAFFGMMTNYSENILGIFYRRKNEKGEWSGGAMYYLQDGLGAKKGCKHIGKVLAVLFAIFAVLASFGIGNLAQINTISSNMRQAFSMPDWSVYIIGAGLLIVGGLVIVGGIKRIASVTEKLVPFMVVIYIVGTVALVIMHADKIGMAFSSIFQFAFGFKAIAGGTIGWAVKQAVTMGFKRGVFSNEAGLGSSVMVHSSSNVKEPVVQGMWGIFEVFADTMIVCTLTALSILTSGLINLETGEKLTDAMDSGIVTQVFSDAFGPVGGYFVAIAILLFAFSTVLGWSHYGTKSWEYLFGTKSTGIYKVVFVAMIFVSAIIPKSSAQLPWDISDTFNGLMMLPNLIGVLSLSGVVYKLTKNYVDRKIKGKSDVKPMLSAFDDIQEEQEFKLEDKTLA